MGRSNLPCLGTEFILGGNKMQTWDKQEKTSTTTVYSTYEYILLVRVLGKNILSNSDKNMYV